MTNKWDFHQLLSRIGPTVLFIGTECYNWTPQDLARAAANAKAMGFTTIAPKRAEGIFKWYKSAAQLRIEKQVVNEHGIIYVPFGYIYGPEFGDDQIAAEAAIQKEMGAITGFSVADMEVQWNNNPVAAAKLAAHMADRPAPFLVSTWADPIQQAWMGVIKALDPVVDAWGPQQYTAWLSLQETYQWNSEERARIMPEVDITSVFTNSPIQVVKDAVARGHKSVWIWEYRQALAKPTLTKQILSLLQPPTKQPPKPVVLPHNPPPATHKKYTVLAGDTLYLIAKKLRLTNWFQDLYLPNRNLLDHIAQSHGQRDSNGGALIYAGTVLFY